MLSLYGAYCQKYDEPYLVFIFAESYEDAVEGLQEFKDETDREDAEFSTDSKLILGDPTFWQEIENKGTRGIFGEDVYG